MIIQILSNLFEEGYLERQGYSLLSPFFAGTNVAFRKQALSQVGSYDVNCLSGEDQDICLRMAQAGWDLYFEPKAKVRHKNVMSFRALLRKWFNYGFHHPYLFKKHGLKRLRIYRTSRKGNDSSLFTGIIDMKFPFNIYVFITQFLTMHIMLVIAIILAILGLKIPAIVVAILTFFIAIHYFRRDIDIKNMLESIVFMFLRYSINLALIAGGLLGGIKLRMFYFSATFDCVG